jgi:hypothetical protein
MRADNEIQLLPFITEASRAHLTQFRPFGGSVAEQLDPRDRVSVTTARVRPDRAAGWSPEGH